MNFILLTGICIVTIFTLAYSNELAYSEVKVDNFQKYSDDKITYTLENFAKQKVLKNAINMNNIYSISDYNTPSFVKIAGHITEFGKSGNVDITITKPDKSIEYIRASLLETGYYSTYFQINRNSQMGMYIVLPEFENKHLTSTYFYIVDTELKTEFPIWFRNNFQWWIEHKITDDEFLDSTQYLINHKIITVVLNEVQPGLQVFVKGEQSVRRGTTQTIITHVTEGDIPIKGALATLRIEDYGENEIRDFRGFTNENGDFIFSWEIPKSFDDIETLLAYISVTHGESSKTHLFKFQVYCLPGEDGCKIKGN